MIYSCKSVTSRENNGLKVKKIDFGYRLGSFVEKIDSINNYYVIYTIDSIGNQYKIVSKKQIGSTCKEIELDSFYTFNVKELLSIDQPNMGSDKFSTPVNYLDLKRCTRLDNRTEVCTEPNITNVYTSTNLLGLCLIKLASEK